MRTIRKSAAFLALILILAFTLSFGAGAVNFESFPDAAGHWAEPFLRAAVSEGLLTGKDRGLLAPDDPATLAETLTILCRMLWPTSHITAEGTDIPAGKWYSDYAATARAMNINFEVSDLKGSYFSRGQAFIILAQAFRLLPAEPDYSVLESFADCGELTDAQRSAAAAMVAAGFVHGDAGRIKPHDPVSRAELVTMLLRMAEVISPTATDGLPGGCVLKNAANLSGRKFNKALWLTFDSGDVDLSDVTAGTVVVLSRNAAIKTNYRTYIDRLVIAGGRDDALEISFGRIGTLVIAPGSPKTVTVRGSVNAVELTADGCDVTVYSTPSSRLVISGKNNTVTLVSGGTRDLVLTPLSRGNSVTSSIYLSSLTLDGHSNAVSLSAGCYSAVIGGSSCSLVGNVTVSDLTVASRTAQVKVNGQAKYAYPTGAQALDLALAVPNSFRAGQSLQVTASVTGYEPADCTLTWTLDGAPLRTDSVAVNAGTSTFTYNMPISLYAGMDGHRVIGAILTYPDGSTARAVGVTCLSNPANALDRVTITLTPQDHTRQAHVKATATLKSPVPVSCTASWYVNGKLLTSVPVKLGPTASTLTLDRDLGYSVSAAKATLELRLTLGAATASASATATVNYVTAALALATVTNSYAGNYTLEWALTHDYEPELKTVWVNAKGYSSGTQYLIWVNRTYQRVNVFQGSAGKWTLIKTFLCATGRAGHATPVGVYTTTYKQTRWDFGSYIVAPVVRFKQGSGYAFHSRLWNRSHTALVDAAIGYPASKGCVRMYDEDVQWIYDTIPAGTTVVVY